jgi:AcrR family transcriptional regulator
VQTARRLFSAKGLDVSLASVAREAGVGKATISRHFATRDDLVGAVFLDSMNGYVEVTRQALADPDPWHGFTTFIHELCRMQASDRGFAAVLSSNFPMPGRWSRNAPRPTRGSCS